MSAQAPHLTIVLTYTSSKTQQDSRSNTECCDMHTVTEQREPVSVGGVGGVRVLTTSLPSHAALCVKAVHPFLPHRDVVVGAEQRQGFHELREGVLQWG
jgi:hypothetical protein